MKITTFELVDLLDKAYPDHATLFDKLADRIDSLTLMKRVIATISDLVIWRQQLPTAE